MAGLELIMTLGVIGIGIGLFLTFRSWSKLCLIYPKDFLNIHDQLLIKTGDISGKPKDICLVLFGTISCIFSFLVVTVEEHYSFRQFCL